jgi:hypothetical protein
MTSIFNIGQVFAVITASANLDIFTDWNNFLQKNNELLIA